VHLLSFKNKKAFTLARLIIVTLLIPFSISCSPIKGYPGPELPEDKIARVNYKTCDEVVNLLRASTEGIEFGSMGITLLPGEKVFDVSVEIGGRPYDCIPQTVIDEAALNRCNDRRASAISNNARSNSREQRSVPICIASDFMSTVYHCQQSFVQHICSFSKELTAGTKYDICVFQKSGSEIYARLTISRSSLSIKEEACVATTTEVRRLQFSEYYP